MASLSLVAIHQGGGFVHPYGLTDFAVGTFQGQLRLFAASGADGGVSSFALRPGAAATFLADVPGTSISGSLGVADLELATVGGQPMLLAAGRYDDAFAFRMLGADGGFQGTAQVGGLPVATSALTDIEVVPAGTNSYMLTGRENGQGISVFEMTSGPGLSYVGSLLDDDTLTLGNVSALAALKTGSSYLVFAASSTENGITSLILDGSGGLAAVETVLGMKGIGIYRPTELATLSAGGANFLVVGAAGSGNLTIYQVGPDGNLTMRDMVWDTLETRFRSVTAIETFELNGRGFVLAGGTDGGLTVFELGLDGRLYFLANALDTAATTLSSVSAIEAVNVSGEIQVFVASATEAGVTQFTIDLGAIGNIVSPSSSSSAAVGSPGDDFLIGSDGRDTLSGMRGNDRIVDGGGIDTLYGGAGADTFVFVQDGFYDVIKDFEPGIDRINLSDFARLYSMADLTIHATDTGARIGIGDEAILVFTNDGQPLTAADFSTASFVF